MKWMRCLRRRRVMMGTSEDEDVCGLYAALRVSFVHWHTHNRIIVQCIYVPEFDRC